jgi:plasmid stability protein
MIATSHSASDALAFCNMRTLYLRNVPDEVGAQLERLAAREGLSLSAFAVRELAAIARRADNPSLLAGLPDLGIHPRDLVGDLERGRETR